MGWKARATWAWAFQPVSEYGSGAPCYFRRSCCHMMDQARYDMDTAPAPEGVRSGHPFSLSRVLLISRSSSQSCQTTSRSRQRAVRFVRDGARTCAAPSGYVRDDDQVVSDDDQVRAS